MQVNPTHPQTAPAAQSHDSRVPEISSTSSRDQVQVRTWLGDHLITDFTAPAGAVKSHIEAVSRLMSGLRLTVEAVHQHPVGDR